MLRSYVRCKRDVLHASAPLGTSHRLESLQMRACGGPQHLGGTRTAIRSPRVVTAAALVAVNRSRAPARPQHQRVVRNCDGKEAQRRACTINPFGAPALGARAWATSSSKALSSTATSRPKRRRMHAGMWRRFRAVNIRCAQRIPP
jgi:hypothetical protein